MAAPLTTSGFVLIRIYSCSNKLLKFLTRLSLSFNSSDMQHSKIISFVVVSHQTGGNLSEQL